MHTSASPVFMDGGVKSDHERTSGVRPVLVLQGPNPSP